MPLVISDEGKFRVGVRGPDRSGAKYFHKPAARDTRAFVAAANDGSVYRQYSEDDVVEAVKHGVISMGVAANQDF